MAQDMVAGFQSSDYAAAMAAVNAATASSASNFTPMPPTPPPAAVPLLPLVAATALAAPLPVGGGEEEDSGDEVADDFEDEASLVTPAAELDSGPPRKKKRRLTEEQIHQLSLARDVKGVTGKKVHMQHRLQVAAEIGLPESAVRNWLNNHKRKRATGQPAMRMGHTIPAQAVPPFSGHLAPFPPLLAGGGMASMDWPNMGLAMQPPGMLAAMQPAMQHNTNLTTFFLSQPNQFAPPPQPQPQQPQQQQFAMPPYSSQLNFMGNGADPSPFASSNALGMQPQSQPHAQHSDALQQLLAHQHQQQQQVHHPFSLAQQPLQQQQEQQHQQLEQHQQQFQLQQHLNAVMGDLTSPYSPAAGGPSSSSSSPPSPALSARTDPALISYLQSRLLAQHASLAASRAAQHEAERLQQQQQASHEAEIMAQIQKIQRYNQVAVEQEQGASGAQLHDYAHLHAPSQPSSIRSRSGSGADYPPAAAAPSSSQFDGADALMMAASAASAGAATSAMAEPALAASAALFAQASPQPQPLGLASSSASASAAPSVDTLEGLRAQIRSLQQKLTAAFQRRQDESATLLKADESKQPEDAPSALLEATGAPSSLLRVPTDSSGAVLGSAASSLVGSRAHSRRGSGSLGPASSEFPLLSSPAVAPQLATSELLFDKGLLDDFFAQDLQRQTDLASASASLHQITTSSRLPHC